jgi:hypothetical protein
MNIQEILEKNEFEIRVENYGIRYRARVADSFGDDVVVKRPDGTSIKQVVQPDHVNAHRLLVESLRGSTLDDVVQVPADTKSGQEEALEAIYGLNPDVDKGEEDLILNDLYNPNSMVAKHYEDYRKDPTQENKDKLTSLVHRAYDRDEDYKNDGKKPDTAAPSQVLDPADAKIKAATVIPPTPPSNDITFA